MVDADNIKIASEAVREIEAEQRKERKQIKDDAELMQGLLKHPGWPRYMALVEAVSQNYYGAVMKPMENTFEVVKSEYAKGTLNGLSVAASLPSAKIREARELTRQPDDAED